MTENTSQTRRQLIQALTAGSVAGLAGCSAPENPISNPDGSSNDVSVPSLGQFRGSGPLVAQRPPPGGTSIADLPDLSGRLGVYLGGGEGGIYARFVQMLEEIYPDFSVQIGDASSSALAQTIVEEVNAGAPQADIFWSIDASSLGFVANNDAYEPLPSSVLDPVPAAFQGSDGAWVGVAGRARSIPYNTEAVSSDDIPETVQDLPDSPLAGSMGWAPTYGAFKSFITAMRLLNGREATTQWLVSMREAGTELSRDEFIVSQRVADGAIDAGFANHYYAMRVRNQRPDAPIDLAFTSGDAGALVNVAGALRIKGTQKPTLANQFIRHLLSAEAQEFFTTVNFSYPMIEGIQPVGGLPTVDELNPPDIDLSKLSNLDETLEIMREAGVLG